MLYGPSGKLIFGYLADNAYFCPLLPSHLWSPRPVQLDELSLVGRDDPLFSSDFVYSLDHASPR